MGQLCLGRALLSVLSVIAVLLKGVLGVLALGLISPPSLSVPLCRRPDHGKQKHIHPR